MMKEIIEFFKCNQYGSLSTSVGNQPDTRPMEMVYHSEKGFFFYTSTGEDVERQLKDNTNVCFVSTDEQYNYVKLRGSVEFSNQQEDKKIILEKSTFAKQVFKDSSLDNLVVFYLPHGKAMMHMHGNTKPTTYDF